MKTEATTQQADTALGDASGSAMSLSDFQQQMDNLNRWAKHGCSNHGCQIGPPKGMGTNAICKCTPHEFSERLLWLAAELSKHGRYRRWPNDRTELRLPDNAATTTPKI